MVVAIFWRTVWVLVWFLLSFTSGLSFYSEWTFAIWHIIFSFFPSVFIDSWSNTLKNNTCTHKTFLDFFSTVEIAWYQVLNSILINCASEENKRKKVLISPFSIEHNFVLTPQSGSQLFRTSAIFKYCKDFSAHSYLNHFNRGCNQNRSCGVNIGWQQEDQIQFRFDRYSLLDQKLKYQVLWRKHLKLPYERIEIERGFFPLLQLTPTHRTHLSFGCHLRNQTIQHLLVLAHLFGFQFQKNCSRIFIHVQSKWQNNIGSGSLTL